MYVVHNDPLHINLIENECDIRIIVGDTYHFLIVVSLNKLFTDLYCRNLRKL